MCKYDGKTKQECIDIALDSELKTMRLLEEMYPKRQFQSRHYDKECFLKGDISDNKDEFWEVKDDSRICETDNVFLEDVSAEGYPGWLHYCQAKYLCVIDQTKEMLYILDFPRIQKKYRLLAKRVPSKGGYGYVIPLETLRKKRLLLSENSYYLDEWGEPWLMI